jgi:hypothetical protein
MDIASSSLNFIIVENLAEEPEKEGRHRTFLKQHLL